MTRILIFMLAYNAEQTISETLSRIPESLGEYETEVLIIDDGSTDRTLIEAKHYIAKYGMPFKTTLMYNPVNQGYGGNVKIGLFYALENNFDAVCLTHGDGQYAPEMIPTLVKPLINQEADVVFGSRMINRRDALAGKMPFYKWLGNIFLTYVENKLLNSHLSEFHTGMRLYSRRAIERIPFHLNSNKFDFDTEIIIQILFAGLKIKEFPIKTFYGNEVSHVNGWVYALQILKDVFLAKAQTLHLCYQRKFDLTTTVFDRRYFVPKKGLQNPYQAAISCVPENSRVLELGSADGSVGCALKKKGCHVTGIDLTPPPDKARCLDRFIKADLNDPLPVRFDEFDTVIALDLIGHVAQPDQFLDRLYETSTYTDSAKLIITAGNIAFFINRLQLLFGYFNYGRRGILDRSHTRLYTKQSLRRALEEGGFIVEEIIGFAAPFDQAFGNNWFSRCLITVNQALLKISLGLFAYRFLYIVQPSPRLEYLLEAAWKAAGNDKTMLAEDRIDNDIQSRPKEK